MIDTVCAVISVREIPLSLVRDRWEYDYACRGKRESERYHLKAGDEVRHLRHVRLVYDKTKSEVWIEASLPRVAYGHNVSEIEADIAPETFSTLDKLIAWGGLDLPTVADWNVRRADFMYNFRPATCSAAAALAGLLSLQPTGRLTAHRIDGGTVYFQNKGKRRRYQVVIYDKHAEVLEKDKSNSHLAKDVIRIELRAYGRDMVARALRLPSPVPMHALVDRSASRLAILATLKYLDVRPGLQTIEGGFERLRQKVGAPRARRLWLYFEQKMTAPRREVAAKLGLRQEAARRWDRELRRAGVVPRRVEVSGVIEELLEHLLADIKKK